MKNMMICTALVAALGTGTAMAQDCDEACMTGIAEQYLADVVTQNWGALPWAEKVSYTENNVAMMIGDGFWGAGPGVGDGMFFADADTGNVVWLGVTSEHGQTAYHGLRLKIEDGRISEVESYLGREGTPDLFAATDGYQVSQVFAALEGRKPRRRALIATVEDYFNTKQQNDGSLRVGFTEDCARITNGVNVTHGDLWSAQAAEGCEAQMAEAIYKPAERIRGRRFPVVDEERGIVVALSLEDHPVRFTNYETRSGKPLQVEVEYPNTRGMLEVFKVVDGDIARIEGVSVFLPYYIHDLWAQ